MKSKIKFSLVLAFLILYATSSLGQIVYVTKTGKKYHKSTCRFLKHSQKETTIKKAKELGFLACKVCKPTVKNTSSKSSTPSLSSNKKKQGSRKSTRKITATQCTGKTKSSRRCKRKTKNVNGRCYQH